jgi:toxin ParE1/3/4
MKKYQFTPQAVDDLFDIWLYIAEDNPDAADRVERSIYTACEFLAGSRFSGHLRVDITASPVRFWLVQPYRNIWIAYDPDQQPLQVIRILHAARDLHSILR